MQSVLLVPSKVLMVFIICLLTSSFLLLMTCMSSCVIASVMFSEDTGDILFIGGVCMVVLVLGWFVSW